MVGVYYPNGYYFTRMGILKLWVFINMCFLERKVGTYMVVNYLNG